MELLVASAIGFLTAGGIYLVLRLRTFPVILGISLLTYAVNVFLFSSGRLTIGSAPVLRDGVTDYADPLSIFATAQRSPATADGTSSRSLPCIR